MTVFDARQLAPGWLAVSLAASNDASGMALYRSVSIELFPTGARLVSTDSYMLLKAWVPAIDHDDEPEPALDEAPLMDAVAIDQHGRGKGLLGHVLKLTKGENTMPQEVRLRLDQPPVDEEGQLDGLAGRTVTLEHPDHERVILPMYEGEFPHWRKLVGGFKAEATTGIAMATEMLGRLGKLGKVQPGPLVCRWAGELGAVSVALPESEQYISGLVMPTRWDFDRHAPATDDDPEA